MPKRIDGNIYLSGLDGGSLVRGLGLGGKFGGRGWAGGCQINFGNAKVLRAHINIMPMHPYLSGLDGG